MEAQDTSTAKPVAPPAAVEDERSPAQDAGQPAHAVQPGDAQAGAIEYDSWRVRW